RFIFGERGGIYIIDLQQTLERLEEAAAFARNLAERGGSVLFVGTKKQAMDAIAEQAQRVGMPFVHHRWLGGLLTNWRTISDRIDRLHELRRLRDEGQLELLPPKERIAMLSELEKLEANLGGVAQMRRQPDAVFIVDLRKEQLAVREARRLGLPVVALVDTNCDPDEADYVIPGNDDAIRSCSLIVRAIAASLVKELRDQTGAGMMDCKRALEETGGDLEAAKRLLRERGMAQAGKRAGRETTEGLVGHRLGGDGSRGTMVAVGCETEPVARNEEFQAFARKVPENVAAQGRGAAE